MYATLASNLKDISKQFDKVNHGGCGLVAKHLYNSLKAKGINVELKVSEGCNISLDDDPNTLIDAHLKGDISQDDLPNHHIFIQLPNGLLIDGSGVINAHYSPCTYPLLYENLEYMLNLDIWNDTFIECNSNIISSLKGAINNIVDTSILDTCLIS